MGMAGGAFKGDMERAKLRLQARQIANQNNQAMEDKRLRQQELADRQASREAANALTNREMDIRERQQGVENDLRQQQLDDNRAHLERQDAMKADLMAQRMAQQQKVYSGYEQLAKQAKAQQQQRKEQGQSAVASVMKLAMNSGGKDPKTGKTGKGMVPMYALQALNRDMGFDGENQGFVSGGYTSNGDFFLQFAQKDPQSGQLVTKPQVLKPIEQYKIMHQQSGIFDNNDRGNMAAQLKQAGFRDDEILLASGIDQTQLEQMQKLAKSKQVQGETMKEKLSALTMLKGYIDGEGANIDAQTLDGLKAAYANGIQGIASQFAPKAPEAGVNAPTMNEDGTLTLPNGTTLRKDQEYTNPQDGKKYVWRGGDVKNFEALSSEGDDGGQQPQQTQQPQKPLDKYQKATAKNDAFDVVNPEGMPARDAMLAAQGGYENEDPSMEEGNGPRNANVPVDYGEDGQPTGGMAAGATGGNGGGAAPQGNEDMQKMYEQLKKQGVLDDGVTFEQFLEMRDPEEEEMPAGGEGGGGE